MRSATIPTRDKRRACARDCLQRGDDIRSADARRIASGPDQDEVVVHHRVAPDAMALGEEPFFRRARVHEHDIGIAASTDVERLTRTKRDYVDLDARPPLIDRQQIAEQTGLLGRSRRCDGDEGLLRLRRKRRKQQQRGHKQTADYHGSSPSRNCAASGETGCLKKRPASARSTSFPWCSKRISSAMRRACPRLWV